MIPYYEGAWFFKKNSKHRFIVELILVNTIELKCFCCLQCISSKFLQNWPHQIKMWPSAYMVLIQEIKKSTIVISIKLNLEWFWIFYKNLFKKILLESFFSMQYSSDCVTLDTRKYFFRKKRWILLWPRYKV